MNLFLKGLCLPFSVCKDNKHKDVKLIHENNSSKIHKIELPREKKNPMKRLWRMKTKIMVYWEHVLKIVERYLCLMFKLYNKYYAILCVHDTHNA